jgi:hypothetical protein
MTDRAVSGWPSAGVRLSSGISILRERCLPGRRALYSVARIIFSSFRNEQGHHRWEAQDDRETFVFTVEPCSFPQSRLGKRVYNWHRFWSQKKEITVSRL